MVVYNLRRSRFLCLLALICNEIAFGQDSVSANREALQGSAKNPKRQVIENVLQLHEHVIADQVSETAQQRLLQIYKESIQPLAEAYHFSDLNRDAISEGEIFAKPMILFIGPWSAGKSSMINYLLGIEEDTTQRLHTGAQPTTSDFTVMMQGPRHRVVKGMQLVADKKNHFSPLQKFGLGFLERFQGIELPSKLLERVMLVDTPGIIENKKQQARGYPFNDVSKWFIDRAQLVFLIFDPSKLDVGSELEVLFSQLKGHEGKLRLILNKADTISAQELMRVYGALFWSLAPLVHEVEPPRVYVGSMWSKPYQQGTMHALFKDEELSLLTDMHQAIRYQLENKIAATRRHAFLVRLHALIVNRYLETFYSEKGTFFGDNNQLWASMLSEPDKYSIFQHLMQQSDISIHDMPTKKTYQDFFAVTSKEGLQPLSYHCNMWSGCDMEKLVKAITTDLPNLLSDLRSGNITGGQCSKDKC